MSRFSINARKIYLGSHWCSYLMLWYRMHFFSPITTLFKNSPSFHERAKSANVHKLLQILWCDLMKYTLNEVLYNTQWRFCRYLWILEWDEWTIVANSLSAASGLHWTVAFGTSLSSSTDQHIHEGPVPKSAYLWPRITKVSKVILESSLTFSDIQGILHIYDIDVSCHYSSCMPLVKLIQHKLSYVLFRHLHFL